MTVKENANDIFKVLNAFQDLIPTGNTKVTGTVS